MYRQPSLGAPFRSVRQTKPHKQSARGRSVARFAPLFRARLRQRIPPRVAPLLKRGATYLGEDEAYYYVMEPEATDGLGGLFKKIGKTFKKIPKAFAPKNLYKTFIDTTLTVASGGLYLAAPKSLKKDIRGIANIAVPVIAGGVLATVAGPAVMGALMPKLIAAGNLLSRGASNVFGMFGGSGFGTAQDPGSQVIGQATGQGYYEGGAVDPVAIGGAVLGLLQRLPQYKQAEVVERLTPEDLAYMERYNRVPPHLEQYFNQMGQVPAMPQGGYGAAELYPGAGPVAPVAPVEAGLFGNMDPMTLGLLIGVPAVFFLLTQSGKK